MKTMTIKLSNDEKKTLQQFKKNKFYYFVSIERQAYGRSSKFETNCLHINDVYEFRRYINKWLEMTILSEAKAENPDWIKAENHLENYRTMIDKMNRKEYKENQKQKKEFSVKAYLLLILHRLGLKK